MSGKAELRLARGAPNTMSCWPVARDSTSAHAAATTLDGVPYDIVGTGTRMEISSRQGLPDVGNLVGGTRYVIDDPWKAYLQNFLDAEVSSELT